MTCIGLHLTKCAGTTLMSDLRRRLTEDEYLILSSFWENLVAGRPDFWEVANPSQIRFIFGHYVHELMIPYLELRDAWSFFLFTGVRNPLERGISQYRHLSRVTGVIQEPIAFVETYGSSMCDEILRAFPSFINSADKKHEAAAQALTCFDYIYSTEAYSETIGRVYDSLELPRTTGSLPKDNVNDMPIDQGSIELLTEHLRYTEDVRLYAIIEPFIGQDNVGKSIAEALGVARARENWFSKLNAIQPEEALSCLFDYHSDVKGYELSLLPSLQRHKAINLLNTRFAHLARTIRFLNTREY